MTWLGLDDPASMNRLSVSATFLIYTEQVMCAFLQWKRHNCHETLQQILQEGQQAIQKMLVFMAYKCISMSCTLSEINKCVLRLCTQRTAPVCFR